MKKCTLAIGVLTISLASVTQADITFNIINNTSKPLEFSLMVPRTATYSNLEQPLPTNIKRPFLANLK